VLSSGLGFLGLHRISAAERSVATDHWRQDAYVVIAFGAIRVNG